MHAVIHGTFCTITTSNEHLKCLKLCTIRRQFETPVILVCSREHAGLIYPRLIRIDSRIKGMDSEPHKTPYVYVKYHHKFIPGTRECISGLLRKIFVFKVGKPSFFPASE